MNHENLLNALKDRFTVDGMIAVKDVELLIWTATTVNSGRVVNPTPVEDTGDNAESTVIYCR